ncbi:hypothetical protein LNV23_20070 [Paucibacter sp. DJ1R-11]|nr:hypothetical protein [Paucibacter sp. DJ1R-11]
MNESNAPRVAADWYALHIHLSEPVLAARFVSEWVQPRVRAMQEAGRIGGWFYLNYWDGGPHLRVRVRGLDALGREQWLAEVRGAVADWRAPTPPTRESFYGAHGFDGQPVDVAKLEWFDEGTVRVVDYEPEYQRYGGPQALVLAEQMFEQTSTLSCALLRASATRLSLRLAQALKLMPLYARALHGDDLGAARRFFADYATFWAAYSAGTRALADLLGQSAVRAVPTEQLLVSLGAAPGELDSVSARLLEALQRHVAGLRRLHAEGQLICPYNGRVIDGHELLQASLTGILTSQMHMHNNRLGLVPGQELMLARQVAAAAAAAAGALAPAAGAELLS